MAWVTAISPSAEGFASQSLPPRWKLIPIMQFSFLLLLPIMLFYILSLAVIELWTSLMTMLSVNPTVMTDKVKCSFYDWCFVIMKTEIPLEVRLKGHYKFWHAKEFCLWAAILALPAFKCWSLWTLSLAQVILAINSRPIPEQSRHEIQRSHATLRAKHQSQY